MDQENLLSIEIVYASPDRHWLEKVSVPEGATIAEAISLSGIAEKSGIDTFENHSVGIFSRKVGLESPVAEGDRIEIYRPLVLTPNEIRLLRAEKKRQKSSGV
ncbi:MAG: putative ubiquitin-RnfH superfamily antitoxin RatB of RatAB toxin-antitoxin module [Parasphingorhabdus sp.]|jgi:putative ubiquitin-RnfH superfamily antitoxin RatB of RatAB toxin-antitoxin module